MLFRSDLAHERQRQKIADLAGRGRATGVPRLLPLEHGVVLLWNDVAGDAMVVQAIHATIGEQ